MKQVLHESITEAAMRLCKTSMSAIMLSMVLTGSVHAQLMCSLGVGPAQQRYDPRRDQAPAPRADQELRQIYNMLCPRGCGSYLLVSNPTTPNAMAMPIGRGQSKIAYRPDFMDRVAQQYGGGATFGILAHEFGHHIDLHTTPLWMNTSWSRELKADAWAGCALARTGIGTRQVENSLRAIAAYPSPSHPGWPQRHQAVRTGFVSCGGHWLNSFNSLGPPPLAQVCQTQFGSCQLVQSIPVGSSCFCSAVNAYGGMMRQPGIAR